MKKCKSCQTEIDEKATKCPHCQTDQRNWFGKHKIITGFIVIILVMSFFSAVGSTKNDMGGSVNTQSTKPEQETKAQAAPTAIPTPIVLNAREFADEFDDNQVAAETKWKNKLIEFSAQISNITDSGISFYNVASKEFSGTQILCRVQNKDQVMSVKNGQTITVRGVVGDQTIGIIGINDCIVVK